jgi:hypothetical protein
VTEMLKTIDDEFARYLASYLAAQGYMFVNVHDDSGLWLDEDALYELIKEFRQELP